MTDQTRLIGEALERYIAMKKAHLRQIDEGIAAAIRWDFASEKEVQAEFAKWHEK
jgi:predicted transcriptional regulator